MKTAKILCAALMVAAVVLPDVALAKKKPASTSSRPPTAEERHRAYEQGIKSCRKQWGAALHEVRVEKYYGKWSIVCYHY